MKRLRRWLFNGLAALSLLLCVGTVTMWVRSYWRLDHFGLASNPHFGVVTACAADSFDGYTRLDLNWIKVNDAWETRLHFWHREYPELQGIDSVGDSTFLQRRGFRFYRSSLHASKSRPHIKSETDNSLYLPHWFVALLLLALPITWTSVNRLKPPEPSKCQYCGYDLRATPDRCPECGTITPKKEIISS